MLRWRATDSCVQSLMEVKFSKSERLLAGAGLLTFGAGCFVVWYFKPGEDSFFPGCPLLEHTGLACPGCGLTRGFHALFHGDIYTALDYNALVPVFAIGFAWAMFLMGNVVIRGKKLTFSLFPESLIYASIVLLALFGILRNLPYEPFSFLFP